MYRIRLVSSFGGTSPIYLNKYIFHFHALSVILVACWLASSTGVILNHMWNEPCDTLMEYLLVMSVVSLVSVCGFIFMGYTYFSSDKEWVIIFSILSIEIMSGAVALGWGVMLVYHQFELCYISSPRTYFYSLSFTALYAVSLVMTSGIAFVKILPSLMEQASLRSRVL